MTEDIVKLLAHKVISYESWDNGPTCKYQRGATLLLLECGNEKKLVVHPWGDYQEEEPCIYSGEMPEGMNYGELYMRRIDSPNLNRLWLVE